MFIALRDLAYAKGRFSMMTLVIALIAFLMTFLTGLAAGLIKNNISGLMALDVTHIAFEYDDKPTYRNTMVERAQWEEWAANPGVSGMEPMGHTIFTARTQKDDPLELVLWGIRPGSFVDPGVDQGVPIGGVDNGVVISRLLAERDGVAIGDRITRCAPLPLQRMAHADRGMGGTRPVVISKQFRRRQNVRRLLSKEIDFPKLSRCQGGIISGIDFVTRVPGGRA